MNGARYPEMIGQLGAEMLPRVQPLIDSLEKELCVDVSHGNPDQKAVLLTVLSLLLLDRSAMMLASLGMPREEVVKRADGSYKLAVEVRKRRGQS